ncbi:2Fe-2S iron-sulfur cluster binding domain-containing protein [Pseudoduganella sp. FT93W]|uniref:2Fe-2S iron-sulfur cluster binding domain-containing protein n=1 Tax=Duganella fentianensis TaxID=2692177 RepID=A0A845I6K8_9BURK|nr:ferredoxin reductase [Duganella fentianensis]MYN47148.1 2Fe-2S iron-sulfur cluster binding domain-containing protein [Duganella fentianensis]
MTIQASLARLADMFAYPLRHSHYVELVNPLWTTHKLMARVISVQQETDDSRTLTLRPGTGWRSHRPGQFVRLGVPIDGQRHTRTYSISSAPNREDGCITVTVKAVPGGRVSQHLVQQVQVGEYLPLGEPQGEFVLPESMPVRPLFITAGSGITPIMSMLRNYVQELEVIPDSVHLHYAPHPREAIFGSELAALAASQPHYKLQHIYTREGGAHFNAAQLEAVCPDWRAREVWACGPASLLEAVEAHWHAAGLDHQLHVERFHAPIAISTEAATAGRVRFAASATEAASDGVSNLLRIAEDAGLNPKHGCRMGICHGCDTKLVSGSVRDLRNGTLIAEPGDTVQVCVCAAVGDVELAL